MSLRLGLILEAGLNRWLHVLLLVRWPPALLLIPVFCLPPAPHSVGGSVASLLSVFFCLGSLYPLLLTTGSKAVAWSLWSASGDTTLGVFRILFCCHLRLLQNSSGFDVIKDTDMLIWGCSW